MGLAGQYQPEEEKRKERPSWAGRPIWQVTAALSLNMMRPLRQDGRPHFPTLLLCQPLLPLSELCNNRSFSSC